jgi:putative tricarboxylic transport membrane protein
LSDRLADRIVAACTLLLAAVYLYATATLPAMDIGDPLGPKAFPVLLGSLLALAGVLLLLESRSKRALGESGESGVPPARPLQVAGVSVITVAFFALLEPLGYLIAFSLYLFVLMLWLHRRSPLVCLATAVLFALGSYTLFAKALGVALAKGLLYF